MCVCVRGGVCACMHVSVRACVCMCVCVLVCVCVAGIVPDLKLNRREPLGSSPPPVGGGPFLHQNEDLSTIRTSPDTGISFSGGAVGPDTRGGAYGLGAT